jgi:hypothetical protein
MKLDEAAEYLTMLGLPTAAQLPSTAVEYPKFSLFIVASII